MADTETWQEEGQDFDAPVQVLETTVVAQTAELPDIKLFGKWSCDDVQVSDMSLQVCFIFQCREFLVKIIFFL